MSLTFSIFQNPSEWLETVLLDVTTKSTNDKDLVAALDTIARYILGPDRVAQITEKRVEMAKHLESRTCNETSPEYYNNTVARLRCHSKHCSRAMMSSDGIEVDILDTDDIWSTLETGTILIESDQGKKTHMYFKTLTSKTTFGTDARNRLFIAL